MRMACEELDETVDRICKRHDPLGCLPFLLTRLTRAILAGVTARSLRWYFAVAWSIGGAAMMLIILYVFRTASWLRHHPLLAQMYRLKHDDAVEDADFDRMKLGQTIVRHYLPPQQGELLLARLEEAEHRTASLLGLDDEGPETRGGA
jgi:hypothetical protein